VISLAVILGRPLLISRSSPNSRFAPDGEAIVAVERAGLRSLNEGQQVAHSLMASVDVKRRMN
jgi:hypothetical protein